MDIKENNVCQLDPESYDAVNPSHIALKPQQWMPQAWNNLCEMCGLKPDSVSQLVLTPGTVDVFFGSVTPTENIAPDPKYRVVLQGTQLREKLEAVPGAELLTEFANGCLYATLQEFYCIVNCEELRDDPLFTALRVRLQQAWPDIFGEPEPVEEGFLESYDKEFVLLAPGMNK